MTNQAVATRDNPATVHPIVKLESQLSQRLGEFKKVLPAHISPEKLQRTILTAVQSDPDLLKADRASLITACMKAAQDGLLPDKREAALVIFKTRQKVGGQWSDVKLVQYMPMAFGVRKKILQSGEVRDIQTAVVYRQEIEAGLFLYEEGTERMLRHKPNLDPDFEPNDADIACAYSVATLTDGSKTFEVMRRSEINKVREKSQTGATRDRKGDPREPSGPWVDWFSEMARKTVMRRHSKTLPMSGDLLDVEATDEELYARSTQHVLSAVEPDAPRLSTPPTRAQIAAQDEVFDETTGEVLQEEDEETARRLDREAEARATGAEPETDTPNPARVAADEMIQRCTDAQILGDVINVESDLKKHRDGLGEDLAREVDDAIAAGRARFGKGGE